MDLYSCLHPDMFAGGTYGFTFEGANEKSYNGETNSIHFDEMRVIKTVAFMNFTPVVTFLHHLSGPHNIQFPLRILYQLTDSSPQLTGKLTPLFSVALIY